MYFSDAYIVLKGTITLTKPKRRGFIDTRNRFLASKNNAPFTNCESKTNNVLIDNTEDLDVVIPTYNLLEYGKNYKKTKGSLSNELLHLNYLNYYRVEPNNLPTTNYNDNKFWVF